jgi:hypothetical protein
MSNDQEPVSMIYHVDGDLGVNHRTNRGPDDDDDPLPDGGLSADALLYAHAKLMRYKPKNCCERYCCGGLMNMPLGYPKGTVTSIMTLIIVPTTVVSECGVLGYAAYSNNQTLMNVIIPLLASTMSSVVAFYFGTRSASASEPVQTSPPKPSSPLVSSVPSDAARSTHR